MALSSSDFINLFRMSNTSGDRMMPFLCWARCLPKPEEVFSVMTVSKSCIKSSGCCIAGDFPVFWRKNKDFGVTGP